MMSPGVRTASKTSQATRPGASGASPNHLATSSGLASLTDAGGRLPSIRVTVYLDVSGDDRGCNTLTGTFTVHEATLDSGGNVVAFAADAQQHCEGGAPALRVRFA